MDTHDNSINIRSNSVLAPFHNTNMVKGMKLTKEKAKMIELIIAGAIIIYVLREW